MLLYMYTYEAKRKIERDSLFSSSFLASRKGEPLKLKKIRLFSLVWTIWFESMRTHNIIWSFYSMYREHCETE